MQYETVHLEAKKIVNLSAEGIAEAIMQMLKLSEIPVIKYRVTDHMEVFGCDVEIACKHGPIELMRKQLHPDGDAAVLKGSKQ